MAGCREKHRPEFRRCRCNESKLRSQDNGTGFPLLYSNPNPPPSSCSAIWTAGESHGKTLIALVDGFPAGRHDRR